MIRKEYIGGWGAGQIHIAETADVDSDVWPILLLHQTPRSHDEFREVMGFLSGKVKCVAMDLPGMGGSSIGRDPATIEYYAEAVSHVVENLGFEKITLCGHHTGGVVAIEYASKHPLVLDSLILSSTPWVDEEARRRRAGAVSIDCVTHSREGYHLTDLWRQRSAYYPEQGNFMDRFMLDALQARDPSEGHLAVGRYEMERAVGDINCPVLLVEHMNDPFAVEYTESLKNAFPQAHLEHIPDGVVALEVTAFQFSEKLMMWLGLSGAQKGIRKLRVVR